MDMDKDIDLSLDFGPEMESYVEKDDSLSSHAANMESDHKIQLARAQLFKIARAAVDLHSLLKNKSDEGGIDSWVEDKISEVCSSLHEIKTHFESDMMFGEENDDLDMDLTVSESKALRLIRMLENGNLPPRKRALVEAMKKKITKQIEDKSKNKIKSEPGFKKFIDDKKKAAAKKKAVKENASAGASSAGGIASIAMPVGPKKKAAKKRSSVLMKR